ncbi:MAG: hypothetical protein MR530_05505, partial [Clostridiales bacterium]|nr:hypothetical protein [Clostridiales bacterium]
PIKKKDKTYEMPAGFVFSLKPTNSWAFSVKKRMQNYDSVIELKRQMNYNDYITFLSPLQGGKNEDAFET